MQKPDIEENETIFNEERRRNYSDDPTLEYTEEPFFLKTNPETPKGNEQDLKDEAAEE